MTKKNKKKIDGGFDVCPANHVILTQLESLFKKGGKMKKENPIYTEDLEQRFKEIPSMLNHFKKWQSKVTGYSQKSGNPIIPMKNPRKFKIGDLCVGMRNGSSGHLRIGTLISSYYTVNWPFMNQAYVLECEDKKLRVYQYIIKIEPGQIEEIREQRNKYLGR